MHDGASPRAGGDDDVSSCPLIAAAARRVLFAALLLAVALAVSGTAAGSGRAHTAVPDFGPNVKIFDPSMSTAEIKAAVDAVAARQVPNQFGTERDALLFMPGTYGTDTAP